MEQTSKLQLWYKKHKEKILEDYLRFLQFQSVGTDSKYSSQMLSCADWVMNYCKDIGLDSYLIKTHKYPIVFAKNNQKPNAHTLLIYGHYDVQPIDPIELWNSDPFEPEIRDNKVYARGAADDKGQIFYTMVAIRALIEILGELPINIKLCIEGEEECGSIGLLEVMEQEKQTFSCDSLLVVDVGIPDVNTPAITLGARGLIQMEIEISNAKQDLHSGVHGGIVYSANRAMTEVLSKLWDDNNRIQIPNFYDDVCSVSKQEFDTDSFDLQNYLKAFGVRVTAVEKGFDPQAANWILPSLEINGIYGGYLGEGVKTIIPAVAHAKLSCRIVPNQSPEKVIQQIKAFLSDNIPKGMDFKIKTHSSSYPIVGNSTSKLAKASMQAYSEVYNKECKKILTGSSIPIIWTMTQKLKCDVLLIGVGIAEDDIHSPNEHFGLDRFEKGFLIISKIIDKLGKFD